LTDQDIADICASFQRVVVGTLVERSFVAARRYQAQSVASPAASPRTAGSARTAGARPAARWRHFSPSMSLATDNAAMIAAAGLIKFAPGSRHRMISTRRRARL